VKRESVSTLLIESKIHVLAGQLPGLASDSIKNDLALECFERFRTQRANSANVEVHMKARIKITLKNGVLDPQGKAIQHALSALGVAGVEDVRQGKYIEVNLHETSPDKARETVERMCKDLLANTVIENYSYELLETP